MSRGGRGRGRGGKRGGGPNLTQDLLRDNMEDLGIDSFQSFNESNPPPLYPPISIPFTSVNDSSFYPIQKFREITNRLQSSPFYLTKKRQSNDIERYSDLVKKRTSIEITPLDMVTELIEDPSSNLEIKSKYFPAEILDPRLGLGSKLKSKKINGDINLTKFENAENSNTNAAKNEEEGSDIDAELREEDIDEFELEDDYIVDHYASEGDNDGYDDDDGEPTF